MSLLLIGADIYGLVEHLKRKRWGLGRLPKFSVVIPAFNEEKTIVSCVDSVLANRYPKEKLEVVVVNDGSTDGTVEAVTRLKTGRKGFNLRIVSQENLGKARALNNGMKNYISGELVMCLDADSYLAPDALSKAVGYFEDPKVMALAANVRIAPGKGLLNLIQMLEYVICYQMKKAHTAFNIEYIIGGIGSTFRRNFLEKIDYFDTDTVTEDIDVTMKIIRNGNKNVRVCYGADVVAYTQSVLSLRDLVRQRYRWKWGRFQTFAKNRAMFFSHDNNLTKGLSWLYLPYAVFADLAFLLEPFVVLYILLITFWFRDWFTLMSALTIITFYNVMNIIAEETLSMAFKVKLILVAPAMYVLFYALSYVEYRALVASLFNLGSLNKSISSDRSLWRPVRRWEYSGLNLSQ